MADGQKRKGRVGSSKVWSGFVAEAVSEAGDHFADTFTLVIDLTEVAPGDELQA
jgi:hypothetical protein